MTEDRLSIFVLIILFASCARVVSHAFGVPRALSSAISYKCVRWCVNVAVAVAATVSMRMQSGECVCERTAVVSHVRCTVSTRTYTYAKRSWRCVYICFWIILIISNINIVNTIHRCGIIEQTRLCSDWTVWHRCVPRRPVHINEFINKIEFFLGPAKFSYTHTHTRLTLVNRVQLIITPEWRLLAWQRA